jgi:hypothetical protein
MRALCFVLSVLLGGGATAFAQSLGQAAQKEKEKRAAKAKASKPDAPAPKVITQEDLEASRPPEEGTESKADGEASAPSTPGAIGEPGTISGFEGEMGASSRRRSSADPEFGVADDSEARAQQETRWRARAESARRSIGAAENELRAAEREANALGVAAPDGVPDGVWRSAKSKADARLARARSNLESAKRQLEQLEEEARRRGIPPGWLR